MVLCINIDRFVVTAVGKEVDHQHLSNIINIFDNACSGTDGPRHFIRAGRCTRR